MEIRKTELKDLQAIQEIYAFARKFMVEVGNPNQWVDGYPKEELLLDDIAQGHGYVCVEGERIVAAFAFMIWDDPNYAEIHEGAWLDDEEYGVVHRIATAEGTRGVASFCIDWCFDQIPNIRIDTHLDNRPMRNFLTKKGFTECGIVYYRDEAEGKRVAYQINQLSQE